MNSFIFDSLHLDISIDKNIATIHLGKKFVFSMHKKFNEAYFKILEDTRITTLEVDLGDIQHIDSSALGMLLMLRERATNEGKLLLLVRPNKFAKSALELANFYKIFTIH
jgi:anti-anti-sigma factor